MIYASDFRKGITFEIDGDPHVVIDFLHVKPGKGAAFVRTKHKNILTGAIREESFNPDAKFPKAHIETKTMQYLYNDGELYYFIRKLSTSFRSLMTRWKTQSNISVKTMKLPSSSTRATHSWWKLLTSLI